MYDDHSFIQDNSIFTSINLWYYYRAVFIIISIMFIQNKHEYL